MRTTNKVQSTQIADRPAWLAALATLKGEGHLELAFDDTTGLLVWLRRPGGGGILEVTDLVEHDQIEDERFTWGGPVADVDSNEPDRHAHAAAERREILAALSAALRRPHDLLQAVAGTDSPEQARSELMTLSGISESAAGAILAMQIRRFTRTETRKIDSELAEMRRSTTE